MRFHLPFFAILVCTCAAHAQIYKCPDATGRTVIQQAPCSDGREMNIKPATGIQTETSVNDAQLRLLKLKADNEMSEAIRLRKPLVGMTSKQLSEAMGPATKINASNYEGVQKNQVIFERPNETWYVYTRNGVVESIQHRPGTPIGAEQQERRANCPSALTIRNAETSASSNTISEEQKRALWRKVEDMRNCR